MRSNMWAFRISCLLMFVLWISCNSYSHNGKEQRCLIREYLCPAWCPLRDLQEHYELSHDKSHLLWLRDTRCWQTLAADISVDTGSKTDGINKLRLQDSVSVFLLCWTCCIICSWMTCCDQGCFLTSISVVWSSLTPATAETSKMQNIKTHL